MAFKFALYDISKHLFASANMASDAEDGEMKINFPPRIQKWNIATSQVTFFMEMLRDSMRIKFPFKFDDKKKWRRV